MSFRFKRVLLSVLLPVLLSSATLPSMAETQFADVALRVGLLLRNRHYTRAEFDDKISERLLDNYLEYLDYNRVYFTQEDINEFNEKYLKTLDDFVMVEGDLSPAQIMFDRRKQRVIDRVGKIKKELEEGVFEFKSDREVLQSRKEAAWPANAEEADKLWHDILEAELLQEQLRLEALDERQKEKVENGQPVKESTNKDEEGTPRERIIKRYDRFLESLNQEDEEDVANLFLTSLATAYDPHSEYFSQSELDSFQTNMKKSLVGIGALLSMVDGVAEIKGIVVGGPADKSGLLQVGDKIVGVGQSDTGELLDITYMKLQKVVDMIRGDQGSTVRLKIIPADAEDSSQTKEIKIIREEVQLKDKLATAELIEMKDTDGTLRRIGWIDLPSFYADMEGGTTSMTADVERLLERLQKENIQGLIIDVRGNGGGSLEEAIKMTGLFINRGPVVQSKDYRGQVDPRFSRRRQPAYDGPLVVLTDRISASASEILAAALQDYNRAIIVGGRTFGKGSVQTILPVANEMAFFADKSRAGAVKVTIQKFYRISGGSTQERGVIPDINLPSIYDVIEKGEVALKYPMAYDEIKKLNYNSMREGSFPLAELKGRSEKRLNTDQDFQYMKEDMERIQKQLDKNTIALNLEKRQEENRKTRERETARKTERKERYAQMVKNHEDDFKVFKLTLDNVEASTLTLASDFTDEENTGFRVAKDDEDAEEEVLDYPFNLDPVKHEALHVMSDILELQAAPKTAAVDTTPQEAPVSN